MIKERVLLSSLESDMWTDVHLQKVDDFISDSQRLLVAYMEPHCGLCVEHSVPFNPVSELTYFIKRQGTGEITPDNFFKMVQFGTVTAGHIESLLRIMMGIYAPIFFENTSWPDSIKNDFSAQLHKFLASLTDTKWKMEGKTVLYIPNEGMKVEPEVAAKDKELVQRLESMYKDCVLLIVAVF